MYIYKRKRQKVEKTMVFKKMHFINPHIQGVKRNLLNVFLWKLGYYNDKYTPLPAPEDFHYPLPASFFDANQPSVTWINHCTFLIQFEGVGLLTDPIWADRCSPIPFLGPKRQHAPALSLAELPMIHFVLISHNHYDHLDKKTVLALDRLNPEITWIVPQGLKKWFKKLRIKNIVELAWWKEAHLSISKNSSLSFKITSVPSQHFSGRNGFDLNATLWTGWVGEFYRKKGALKRFYFAGDTGYNSHDFKKIGEKWKEMDISFIPIGTYVPRKFMSPVHVEPKDAVQIHQEVYSKLSIGMHWKTFHLSDEPLHQPPYDLFLEMNNKRLNPQSFLVLEPGHQINW